MKTLQIEFYSDLIKSSDCKAAVLLKSEDSYFKNHYKSSPLNILTGFEGTAGEAVFEISKNQPKTTLFVDTRYHLLVDKQAYNDIEIVKMPLGESFLGAFQKKFKKNTTLFIPSDISLKQFFELEKYFNIKTYNLAPEFLKNDDYNNSPVFPALGSFLKTKVNKINYEKFIITNLDEISNLTGFRSFQMKYSSNFKSILFCDNKNKNYILFADNVQKTSSACALCASCTTCASCLPAVQSPCCSSADISPRSGSAASLNNDPAASCGISSPPRDGSASTTPPSLRPDSFAADFEIKNLAEFKDFISQIQEPLYVDYDTISLDLFRAIQNPKKMRSNALKVAVSIKSQNEILKMRENSHRLDFAILNFKKEMKAGLSEFDLVQIFEKCLKEQGFVSPSFKTILSIGENTASIHYSSYDKNKILMPESMVLLDCGGYLFDGLASDITRTFYFGKNPAKIFKTIYTAVLKAFIACFLSNAQSGSELDILARKMLSQYGSQNFFFNHGLGHGIGTSCHQNPPLISTLSKDKIRPFQTHSIEPGLYGGDDKIFGVRIENCVYLDTARKRFSLSAFEFEDTLLDKDILTVKEKEFVENWQKNWRETIQKK